MGIAEVYDSSIFNGAIVVLNNSKDKVNQKCREGIDKARNKLQEAQDELINSQLLLQQAIMEEERCRLEVEKWKAALDAALAAVPCSAEEVAYCSAMLAKATAEYDKAVAHRILMERRVDLVTQAVSVATVNLDTLTMRFNFSEQQFSSCVDSGCNRLQAAYGDALKYETRNLVTVNNSSQGKNGFTRGNATGNDNTGSVSGCPIDGHGGHWDGERGNSTWYPNRDDVPGNPLFNPDKLSWGEILDKYGIDGIPFKNGEPDFSQVSKGTVEIDNFSENRYGKGGNFDQAAEKLAEERGCTPDEVKDWMKENRYTWHERSDCKTMDKVPTEVHGNVRHEGGISEIRNVGSEGE